MGKGFSGFVVLLAFCFCLMTGTLGYHLIEGWPFLDALYMTVITITTVGFHEEHPLSPPGKIFTLVLIFFGFGICVISLSNLTQTVLRGELVNWMRRYFMNAKIRILSNHYILCGYGRMGKVVAELLDRKGIPFVVIESNPEKAPKLADLVHPVVIGNGGSEETLKEAGIDRAKCLISVVSTDAENVFTVMTARRMNAFIHIVCRAFNPASIAKLKVAGANQVVSPYRLSGNRITQAALHPTMVEFVEFIEDVEESDIEMADLIIMDQSQLTGLALSSELVASLGVIVVGIKKAKGGFTFQPRGDTRIEAGDHLVVVGPKERVDRLAEYTN